MTNKNDTSLSRLQILQQSSRGDVIADADFMLRGPGEILGCTQSGLKGGYTVSPDHHWDLLDAASKCGRTFYEPPRKADSLNEDDRLVDGSPHVQPYVRSEDEIISVYDETSVSSREGFALRVMLALFGDWSCDDCNTLFAMDTLEKLESSKKELSQHDQLVHGKIVEFGQSTKVVKTKPVEDLRNQYVSLKPHVAGVMSQVSQHLHIQ